MARGEHCRIENGRTRAERLRMLDGALLYFICDARPRNRPAQQLVAAALDGGVDMVQLRDKRADDATLLATGTELRKLCVSRGALFVMNDRPDLAAQLGADGVHVGQADAPVDSVRRVVGDDLLIGLSAHSEREIDEEAAGCDYLGVGTVFPTPNRPLAAPSGLSIVERAASISCLPFFAIGGIDAGNVERVIDAGGRRVAVMGAVRNASDPAAAAREIKHRLETHVDDLGNHRVKRAK